MILISKMNLPPIKGFNKTSEIGVDIFSPSIFLGYCNFSCHYCMNGPLAKDTIQSNVNIKEVEEFVKKEKSEWLMISGGEPTCTKKEQLISLLEEISSWGCKIGMSTNGSNPEILEDIIKYINYIALDIKASNNDDYEFITEFKNAYNLMKKSKNILNYNKKNRNDFDYEIRTTLFPKIIDEIELYRIGEIVHKEEKWILQQFRHNKNVISEYCNDINPYNLNKLQDMLSIAKLFSDNARIRYV